MTSEYEFFTSLFSKIGQPVIVFDEKREAVYQNLPAERLLAQLNLKEKNILTEGGWQEAEFCMQEQRGTFWEERPAEYVLRLQLVPYPYAGKTYLVVQVHTPALPEEWRELERVFRNSQGKLSMQLNRIYGVAQQLGLNTPEGSELGRSVRRILRMSSHVHLLLNDEDAYTYRVPLNVGDFLNGFIRNTGEICPDLTLLSAPSMRGLIARVMPEDLELVLANLVSNAVRFGGSKIQIAALRREDQICIEVWDNGSGMQEPEKLFEYGYRTPDQRGIMGLGFGLGLSRNLLEKQGGTLEYERRNHKTCFRICLEADHEVDGGLAEWAFEPTENSLSQMRIELSDLI